MADVYCATDTQLDRKVAVKLLYRRFAEDEEFVERFRREASSAASLQHPHVVSVYDRGEWDGTYYIAMEMLEGRSLKQLVTQEGRCLRGGRSTSSCRSWRRPASRTAAAWCTGTSSRTT
jgi:serine/threonine-protein kinase